MSLGKIVTLSSGSPLPQIGLGTWLSQPKEVENAVSLLPRPLFTLAYGLTTDQQVEYAVKTGYRHLDLAMIYQNQDEVGAALKKVIPSVVKREDLWITSKLWNSGHQASEAEKELDETLKQIGTEYLDLYRQSQDLRFLHSLTYISFVVIHWPVAFAPGKGLNPKDPKNEGFAELDLETSLVDTWKVMINLQKTGKVCTLV